MNKNIVIQQSFIFFSELGDILPNIAEQCLMDLKEAQKKYELPIMYQALEANIRQQIIDISAEDHKVKGIVSK